MLDPKKRIWENCVEKLFHAGLLVYHELAGVNTSVLSLDLKMALKTHVAKDLP